MFNADITIFNKTYDEETRSDKYLKTILKGVHVEKTNASQKNDSRLSVNDTLFVIIPYLDGYQTPKKYQESRAGYTFHGKDILVVGIVEKDIKSIKDLKCIDDVYTVDSVEIINYSKMLNHIEVYAS